MGQTEKPGITVPELVQKLGLDESYIDGAKVSGGQYMNFRKGWAKNSMAGGSVAHWFTRDEFAQAEALCGASSLVRWLYGPGNYPRCSTCIRIMSRHIKAGVAV